MESLKFCHVSEGSVHRLFVLDGKPGFCILCNRFLDFGEVVHVVREKVLGYVE